MAQRSGRTGGTRRGPRRETPRRVGLLWGGRARPARGPKPALTLDAIVDAAIAVADADGLAALTMNRVAADLDVTTMALYRYVPEKDALVDLMCDRAVGDPPAPTGAGWRADVAQWARANLSVLRRHPWLLASVARPALGPNWLAWVEAALGALAALRLPPRERLAVVLLVDGHVRGAAQISSGAPATREWAASFGDVLRRIAGDARYAAFDGLAAAGGFAPPAKGEPDAFEFGLQRILDGIEAFSARPARRGRSRLRRRRAE
jgi:AcrR family transcriptional regulator